ncbi:Uma2 family endonuclease [Niabella drilacis]|uniref:Putative restriction endonuclease n=1 Tax=Niabella drilacis (strain DSM 25811 / CCM 8410 / CCUG 62505 / LMG 26954 / E90) TaxID=1285928 RepID=A0A1G6N5K1_NIADE|nr:Uma2 family endonuclease [Niabella drilacis]SDC62687.1 Putative restriction endonuclease [Niabella drilacis]
MAQKKYQPPPRTAMEVYEMLPEGTLAEVINNVLYMSPAPTFERQRILAALFTHLNVHISENDLGECVFSPVDVYLGHNNAVQPDIVFIAKENLSIVRDGKVKGPPDLVVEVLSGNKKHDLQLKKQLYEANGVKEYFIVNPADKEVISYYSDGRKFLLQESKKGKIRSKLLRKTVAF